MLKFDPSLIEKYSGEYVLLGVRFVNSQGAELKRTQIYGQVVQLDAQRGLVLRNRKKGEEYVLPPEITGWEKAEPGEYRLQSTGEVVINPDWLGEMTIPIPDGVDPFADPAEVEVRDGPA